jgi:hypothetical protein
MEWQEDAQQTFVFDVNVAAAAFGYRPKKADDKKALCDTFLSLKRNSNYAVVHSQVDQIATWLQPVAQAEPIALAKALTFLTDMLLLLFPEQPWLAAMASVITQSGLEEGQSR